IVMRWPPSMSKVCARIQVEIHMKISAIWWPSMRQVSRSEGRAVTRRTRPVKAVDGIRQRSISSSFESFSIYSSSLFYYLVFPQLRQFNHPAHFILLSSFWLSLSRSVCQFYNLPCVYSRPILTASESAFPFPFLLY